MRYCKNCLMPDTRPNIYFNEDGICGACIHQKESIDNIIDWDSREKELNEIAEWAKKTTKGAYDCVIGVSGGKDSTFQSLYARDRLGLRPLLVNSEPEGITDIGRYNIENLINLGFDTLKLRPNPQIMKKLVKRCFYEYLNPVKITEYSLWASAYIIAQAFRIPLIIQGENPVLTLGSDLAVGTDGNALKANKQDTLLTDWRTFTGEEIVEKDLFFFHYDAEQLEALKIKGVWLGYYAKEWSQPGNAKFSIKYGLKIRPLDFNPEDIGTYYPFMQLDSDIVQVNQMLKFIKFGFGQCTECACYDIRDGIITREEGIALVKAFDGKCALPYIEKFCNYIDIDLNELWRVADAYRGIMWEKLNEKEWKIINPIWEQEATENVDINQVIRRVYNCLLN